MPRKVKIAFTGADDDRAITGIHDIAFIAADHATAVKGFEVRVGGGTSIMPRVAPTLYEFVEADDGDYLQGRRGRLPHLRPPGLAARQPRPRPHQGLRRQVSASTSCATRSRRSSRATGSTSATSTRADACSARRGGATRPAAGPASLRRTPERRPVGVRALQRVQRARAAQQGFTTVEVKVTRGDLTPEQFRGLGRDHARLHRRLRPHHRAARTSCCAGSATRASTTSGSGCAELDLGDAGADEITDVVSCPGTDSCKLGITSSMGLNAAIQERLDGDEDHDPLTQADPHQDERLPERLQPAPHRQHRLLRRVDQGRRARRSPPTSRTSAATYDGGNVAYGTRLKVRLPAKRAPEAVERWIRLYEADRADGEDVQRLRRARRHRRLRGRGPGPDAARRVHPRDHEHVHRLDEERPVRGPAR